MRKRSLKGAGRTALTLAALVVVTLTGLPSAAQADFQAGVTAYTEGDYATAAREWRAAAEDGDLAAMRNLGHLYRWGKGVPRDDARAAEWYRRAATQGLDRAMVNLAVMYLEGKGVPADPAIAATWLDRASAAGNTDAMVRLADLLERGVGVAANPAEARRLLDRAAAMGNVAARERLDGALFPEDDALTEEPVGAAPATPQTPTSEASSPDASAPMSEPAESSASPSPQFAETAPDALDMVDATPAVPAMPAVRRPETVDGVMLHLGAYPTRAAAEQAWRTLLDTIPDLSRADPYLLSGYVPGRGDLVRLYAQAPDALMRKLCADLVRAGRPCERHRFFK